MGLVSILLLLQESKPEGGDYLVWQKKYSNKIWNILVKSITFDVTIKQKQ